MRSSIHLAFALMLFGAGQACRRPEPTPAFEVRVAPSTMRITRFQELSRLHTSIDLAAARNEYEAFQVVLQASHAPASHIDLRVSDLVHERTGAIIPGDEVALFREYFLYVLQPSGGYDWIPRIEYPGPLLPKRNPYSARQEAYGIPFDNTRIGSVGKPYVRGRRGPGFAFPTGQYTGARTRSYVIQIDQGGNAGQATFRWSDSWKTGFDGDVRVGRWNRSGVSIPPLETNHRSPPVPLNHGIEVWFCSGREPHFQAGHTFHFTAYESMNEVVWGELKVPPAAQAGRYRGQVTVTRSGHPPTRIPLQLTVWDIDLPRRRSITTAYGGWMVSAFYADAPQANWLHERVKHEHRIDNQTVHGHHTAWQGNFTNIDWSAFDREAGPRLTGEKYPDGIPMRRFHLGMYGCGNEWHWKGAAGADVRNVRSYAKRFAEHLKKRDWFDRVYMYCRDEPSPHHYDGIIRDIRAFLAADEDWAGKFMITTRPTPGHPLLPWIDIWCVKYHWGVEPGLMRQLRAAGDTFWCYAANSPYSPHLTYHLDTLKGYEARLIKWAAWKRGAEGFLYWATALDQEYPNPWTTPMNDFGACGDANLLYYGARNGPRLRDNATPLPPIMGPLAGFRLKQIREGLEDWELLLLCEQAIGREATEQLVEEVYRSPGGPYGHYMKPSALERHWTQDDWKLFDVRRKIADAIVASRSP